MIPLLPVSPVHPSESGIYFTCGAFIICNYAKFSLFFRQFHKNMQAYRKHFFPKVVSCFLIFSHPGEKTRIKVLRVFTLLLHNISKALIFKKRLCNRAHRMVDHSDCPDQIIIHPLSGSEAAFHNIL